MLAGPARDAGLDALRSLAALLVLFAHGGYFLFAAWPHFDAYALAGWLGTDLFFALSGFLLTTQLLTRPARAASDSLRLVAWRLWRILPLFWLFIGVHAWLAIAAGRALPESLPMYFMLAQNLGWMHPAFFGEAWNLPVLVAFTLAAPGVLLGASWLGERARIAAVVFTLLLALGIALRAVWVAEQAPLWDEGVRKLVLTRVDACLYGALAALIASIVGLSSRMRGVALFVAASGLLLAAAGFLLLPRDASDAARIVLFVLSGVGSAALCLAGVGRRVPLQAIHAPLARWSWPLYLVNMPVLFALSLAGLGQTSSALDGTLRFVLWMALSLAAACLVHHAIERPWLALRARVFNRAGAAPATSR